MQITKIAFVDQDTVRGENFLVRYWFDVALIDNEDDELTGQYGIAINDDGACQLLDVDGSDIKLPGGDAFRAKLATALHAAIPANIDYHL